MIPREILKKIRQIGLRTNRIVTAFAPGARASARFIVRTPAASKINPALDSIRPLKRRERRAPSPAECPTNPVARIFQDAAGVSPSPWGEGRDEGRQNCLNLTTGCADSLNCCNIKPCNHVAGALVGLADDPDTIADNPAAVADDTDVIADNADAVADDTDAVADDTDTIADDAGVVANEAGTIAGDADTVAAGADIFADDNDGFADDAGGVANVRCRKAGAKFFSAKSVFSSRNHPNPFSLP